MYLLFPVLVTVNLKLSKVICLIQDKPAGVIPLIYLAALTLALQQAVIVDMILMWTLQMSVHYVFTILKFEINFLNVKTPRYR